MIPRAVGVLVGMVASLAAAQGPTVTKVEPPNWWAGHSINPVRLLIRGANLGGAALACGRVHEDQLVVQTVGLGALAQFVVPCINPQRQSKGDAAYTQGDDG